jgi:hypothetical protein
MSELEDALARAQRELEETKEAIAAARGSNVEKLAAQLAGLQAQANDSEAEAKALEEEAKSLRDAELNLLEKLK